MPAAGTDRIVVSRIRVRTINLPLSDEMFPRSPAAGLALPGPTVAAAEADVAGDARRPLRADERPCSASIARGGSGVDVAPSPLPDHHFLVRRQHSIGVTSNNAAVDKPVSCRVMQTSTS